MASRARLPQPISEGAASLVWAPVLALRTGHPMSPCSVPHPTRSSQYDEQGQMAHDPGPKRTPLHHQEQPEAENVTHALQGCHGNWEIQSCLMGLNSHSYLLSDQERAGWEKFTQRQDTRCLHQTLTPGSPALPSPQLRARQEGSTSSRHGSACSPTEATREDHLLHRELPTSRRSSAAARESRGGPSNNDPRKVT